MRSIPHGAKSETHAPAEGIIRADQLKALGWRVAERVVRVAGVRMVRIYFWDRV